LYQAHKYHKSLISHLISCHDVPKAIAKSKALEVAAIELRKQVVGSEDLPLDRFLATGEKVHALPYKMYGPRKNFENPVWKERYCRCFGMNILDVSVSSEMGEME
jgi:hypothetical protein